MGVIKFDVTDVDPDEAKGRPVPRPGVYRAKIKECTHESPEGKDERLKIVVEISTGPSKGYPMYEYINLESEGTKWKLDQFLQALGLASDKKRTGQFDPAKLKGKALQVRVKHETYNDEVRGRVGSFLPLADDKDEDPDADEDDQDPDDTVDEDGTNDEGGGDEDETKDEGGDDDATPDDDYDSWSVPEIRAELKERELATNGGKAVLLKRLRADDNGTPFDD